MESETYKIKKQPCLNCGAVFDGASSIDHTNEPKPNDLAICIECGHIMMYDENFTFRQLTDTEIVEVAGLPEVLNAVEEASKFRKWKNSKREMMLAFRDRAENIKLVVRHKGTMPTELMEARSVDLIKEMEWYAIDENDNNDPSMIVFGRTQTEAKINYLLALGSEVIDAALKHKQ